MFQNILLRLHKLVFITISTLIFALINITFALADGPGDLDITFNGTGIITTSISSSLDIGDSIAVQPDGKIVVVGTTRINTLDTFAVVRYNQDGSLDTSFNSTGVMTTSVGENIGRQSIVIQPNGKIILAGSSHGIGFSRIAIVRYNSNGTLDTDFNSTGIVTTSIGTFSNGNAVAITNGKIAVAGNGDNGNFAMVARYNDNGSLDSSFNGSGIVTTTIGAISDGQAIAVQPDGKLVVAGITNDGSNDDIAVIRYNVDGSLDTAFNGTGIVTTSITNGNDIGYGVALQPDGKIVVVGETPAGGGVAIVVVRYTISGTLDTTLNGTGIVTTSIGQASAAAEVVLQPDNKIVVGGVAVVSGKSNFAVVRYNSNGSLDTTFKGTGIVTTTIGQNTDVGRAIAIQSDGRLLVAGFSNDSVSTSNIAVVRYLSSYFHYLPVILKGN